MELTLINLIIFVSIGAGLAGYVAFILVPAVSSYGRVWERVAAGFLSLFIFVTLISVGVLVGLGAIYLYGLF
ncbi:MAG: hypothetical protein H0U42_00325 [Thermoleophilaceae bacterium]|nr:hypothetical protein [Thermoleophilaceae bacterium]